MVGLYRAGELGVIELTTAEGRISGRYRGGGNCGFKPDMQVLSGTFDGDVFLGTVFVCQEGPSCDAEKAFPFLGIYHQGSLAGDVKLDVGCNSAGLEKQRLNISAASAEDRLLLSRESGSSPAQVASRNANKKVLMEQAAAAFNDAQNKFAGKNFVAARTAIERSLTYDDSNWQAWQLLGGVELELKNVEKGLQSFEKSVWAAHNGKLTDVEMGDLFYNLACAQSLAGKKRDALASLRNALKVGDSQALLKNAVSDPQFEPIRDDPDFKRIVAEPKKKSSRSR